MTRVLCAVLALVCIAMLSSCSYLPSLPHDEDDVATAQMQHIADAVKSHDAAALKRLFSPRAREEAKDLDSGLKYFLSFFPSGKMAWKFGGFSSATDTGFLRETEETFIWNKVSADGQTYQLFYVDYPVNGFDSRNVGLYALGVTPYTTQTQNPDGTSKPFFSWEGYFQINAPTPSGTPGVYVPKN